jgi:dihydropteroate synthase
MTSNIQGKLMDFSIPKVMGIFNITPDSFFEGSRKQTETEMVDRVRQIVSEGADIIDVGGYSSRPNAVFVSEEEELRRLRAGLTVLFREAPDAVVSIDTFRANVARACVEEYGAAIINDISAGGPDERMFDTVAHLQVPYIIMHMRGTPQTMMDQTGYDDLMKDIFLYFSEKIDRLCQKGVNDVWIDPGFGFSKTTAQNYEILNSLNRFRIFERPVLAGFSRKTMIRDIIRVPAEEALNGTTALNMFSLTQGVDILRVHDVKEAVQTVQLFNRIKKAGA